MVRSTCLFHESGEGAAVAIYWWGAEGRNEGHEGRKRAGLGGRCDWRGRHGRLQLPSGFWKAGAGGRSLEGISHDSCAAGLQPSTRTHAGEMVCVYVHVYVRVYVRVCADYRLHIAVACGPTIPGAASRKPRPLQESPGE